MAHVGTYIAVRREAEGLTQEALAELLGVSERIVREWEKGRHEPKIGMMRRLLRAIGGSWEDVDRLLGDDADANDALHLAARRDAVRPLRLTPNEQRLIEVVQEGNLSSEQIAALIAFLRSRDDR